MISIRHQVMAVVVVGLLYVMSYAPVVRLMGGWTVEVVPNWNGRLYRVKAPVCGTTSLPVYRPVDWLIDHGFDRPLFVWADCWGVESEFREAILWR